VTPFTQFSMLPLDVQMRAKLDAAIAAGLPAHMWSFYDLDPATRRAVYETAVTSYYAGRGNRA